MTGVRILMLVATSVATDTRVLREASTLAGAGHAVHIIGRSVPTDYTPPAGITVGSVGTSSVFRKEGGASLAAHRQPPHMRLVRWALLPQHRSSAFGRWAADAEAQAQMLDFDVVHAHDYTALEAGYRLAHQRGIPLVYDTHELWSGRPRAHRPTPWQDRAERRTEQRLGAAADAVITVGHGVADELTRRFGWQHVTVVHNSFPPAPGGPPTRPSALVYAGRLAPHRELEVVAAASARLPLPVTLIGPADQTWLATYDPGTSVVRPPVAVDEVTTLLQEAGIALVTHGDAFANLRLAMPNKVFQAVSAGIPVVATDVGELAAMVREHHLGTLYCPGDVQDLIRAVHDLVGDYRAWCERVAQAQGRLSWAADADRLVNVYAGLNRRSEKAEEGS